MVIIHSNYEHSSLFKKTDSFDLQDSPICLTARQTLGKLGEGYLFLYKIPRGVNFRKEIRQTKNHGVICDRYVSTEHSDSINAQSKT